MVNLTPRSAEICIDFGTSHTVVSIRRTNGRVQQQLFDGSPQLPSAVFRSEDDTLVVGTDAIHHGRRQPGRYEPNPKRRIDDGTVLLGEEELPVTEVIAAVFDRVRHEIVQATGSLGPVTITVPAAWGPTRRHAVTDAAGEAGFGEVDTVPEPVAAATYFVETLGNDVPVGSGVVVYDLGGGTFDASVLRRTDTGFEVLAVEGTDNLGGLDFDQALAEHLAANVSAADPRWRRLTAPTTVADRRHRTALMDEVRRAKERLSRLSSTELTIPLLDLDAHITRDELDTIVRPLLARTVRITQGVIRESRLETDELTGIFLAGAASRMPLIATLLHRDLGLAPITVEQPELAVSEGGLHKPERVSPLPEPALPAVGMRIEPPMEPPPMEPFPIAPPAATLSTNKPEPLAGLFTVIAVAVVVIVVIAIITSGVLSG